ncbi:MCM family protein [Cavenderia fasciculata]|uniref:DNA replication licensing factor MCM7 n=1 Tax=Cavenderia fasciculata TaxID=261658 RepID=F4QEU4_CACFS|nr:MCM family protein [Cavenderia fasciculata]EGG14151.1 MCM family protein [Cavenderia fasciculata]|eukprot:XP_004350859.1 MCM family protein [Cavenderia fasciculata]
MEGGSNQRGGGISSSSSTNRGRGGRGRGGSSSSTGGRSTTNNFNADTDSNDDINNLKFVYEDDLKLCRRFLREYNTLAKPFKYLDIIKQIEEGKLKRIIIELDDMFAIRENIEGELFGSIEFVERIERNTFTYIRLFTMAIDEIIGDPLDKQKIGESDDPILDLLLTQRQQRSRNDKDLNHISSTFLPTIGIQNQNGKQQPSTFKPPTSSEYPKELIRRFEVTICPMKKKSLSPTPIRMIRSLHIGRLVTFTGVVTRVTEVKPMITVATYTCDGCSAEVFQEIKGREFMPVGMCPSTVCANAQKQLGGGLTLQLRGSKFIKFQEMKLQEMADQVPIGHTPRSIKIFVRGELTRKGSPGDVVTVDGVFLPTPYTGHKAIRAGLLADTYVEAMEIRQHKKTYEQLELTDDTRFKVELESKTPDIYERLARSIAPEIYGHLDVKKALLLMMIGGISKSMRDGMSIRGDINICLMGDPGVAKSQLLKHICKVAPRGIYTSGKGSSGVGLTAAVVKDSMTGEFVLEGGSLVLADMGICCIDEFDKMEEADRTAIHEVMEQQTISIAKAGITTTLNARTSILAAANPAYGRYNFKKSPDENFNLPPSLLSRFDLLFLMVDRPNLELDRLLSEHVTFVHQNSKPPALDFVTFEPEFIRAYVSVARSYSPYVSKDLTEFIASTYVGMRKQESETKEPFTYTTARTLLGILRMAQAHARCRAASHVQQSDIEEAIRLIYKSKDSIRIEKDKKQRPTNIPSAIYDLIKNNCKRSDRKSAKYTDILPQIVNAGFTEKHLQDTIEEYSQLNLILWSEQKTLIKLVE